MPLTFHTDTALPANTNNLTLGRVYASLNTDPVDHSERMWVITQVYQTPQRAFRLRTHYWLPQQAESADAPPRSPTQELDSYMFLNGWQPTGDAKGKDALSLLEFEEMRRFDATPQPGTDLGANAKRPARRGNTRQAQPPRVPQAR